MHGSPNIMTDQEQVAQLKQDLQELQKEVSSLFTPTHRGRKAEIGAYADPNIMHDGTEMPAIVLSKYPAIREALKKSGQSFKI